RFTQLRQVMSTDLLTLPAGIDPEKAFGQLHEGRHRVAPVVDASGALTGILTRTGALRATLYRPATDASGELRVGAAVGITGGVGKVGVGGGEGRKGEGGGKAKQLVAAGIDVLVVDTAHGHQERMISALQAVRGAGVPIAAGNVVTAEGVTDLVRAGADIVKV